MPRLVNVGVVLARTSRGLTVQPVLPTMKAHGCHMMDDVITPRATLGPGGLLTSVYLWESAEPRQRARAPGQRVSGKCWPRCLDCRAPPLGLAGSALVFVVSWARALSSQAAFPGRPGPLDPSLGFLCNAWVWLFMAEGHGAVLERH